MSAVFMFPGQSSADPQMIQRAAALHVSARQLLDRARTALGHDALRVYTQDAGARLQSNRDVQLSVFLATQMHLSALHAEGVHADWSVGLSLGEYSHLVHIGALSFESALVLVEARGAAYDTAPHGVMITVLGATCDEVEDAVTRPHAGGRQGAVFVSNYNAPTQHVIAGERGAAEAAAQWLEDECGAHAIETESRVPMHTPLLREVAVRFRPALAAAAWQPPTAPYVPNVTGQPLHHPAEDAFLDALTRHVTQPVRWQAGIEGLAALLPDATFVEVGPGDVLHNMIGRRWLPHRRAATDQPRGHDPASRFRTTVEGLHGRS